MSPPRRSSRRRRRTWTRRRSDGSGPWVKPDRTARDTRGPRGAHVATWVQLIGLPFWHMAKRPCRPLIRAGTVTSATSTPL